MLGLNTLPTAAALWRREQRSCRLWDHRVTHTVTHLQLQEDEINEAQLLETRRAIQALLQREAGHTDTLRLNS